MAKSEAQRQKKLMKKRRKDQQRRAHLEELNPYTMLNPKQKIRRARRYPIHECRINSSWQEKGLATILVSRRQPDDCVVFGVFLVDIFCLGLKNTFCNADFSESRYVGEVVRTVYENQDSELCSSDLAHQVTYGAIDFAQQFGFKPHKDFKLSQYILDTPENIPSSDIVFGKDGKPFFIAGPDDNAPRIIHQLNATAGEGHYDYLYGTDPTDVWIE